MRRALIAVAALLVLGCVAFVVCSPQGGQSSSDGVQAAASGGGEHRAASGFEHKPAPAQPARVTADPGAFASGASEGSTPAVDAPATEQDGVIAVTVTSAGKPVPNADVRAFLRGPLDSTTGHVDWRTAARGVTGEDGVARIAATGGEYLLSVRAAGHAVAHARVSKPSGEKLTRALVTLEAAQSLSGVTVVKGSSEPVPMAELVLTPLPEGGREWFRELAPTEELIVATSDARGRFTVQGIAPGRWQVEARAPSYAPTTLQDVRVPAAHDVVVELVGSGTLEGFVMKKDGSPAANAIVSAFGRGQDPLTAVAGPEGGFALDVSPGSYELSAKLGAESGSLGKPVVVGPSQTTKGLKITLGGGGTIQGTVRAKDGGPVADADVVLSPWNKFGELARVSTDATGHYQLDALAPGNYDLDAVAPGYTKAVRKGLALLEGKTFTVDFELSSMGIVEGVVKDPSGAPLSDVTVSANRRWSSSGGPQTVTGPDGRFHIEGVPAGDANVNAVRPGATAGASKTVKVESGKAVQVELTIADAGALTGHVRTKAGAPAPEGAVVRLMRPSDSGNGGGIEPIAVDAAGTYTATLPAGAYTAAALPSRDQHGFFNRGVPVQIEAGQTTDKDLELPDEVDDVLVAGTVVEPTGQQSADCVVDMFSESWRMSTYSPDGAFRFARLSGGQPPPAFTVTVQCDGRMGRTEGVKPGTRDLEVKLQPGASLSGHVRGSDGSKVDGFLLTYQSADPKNEFGARWNDSEREFAGDAYELGEVPSGVPIRVVVRTRDGRTGNADTAALPSGGNATLDVTINPASTVTGRLVDADTHEGISGAWMNLRNEMPAEPGSMHSDADGRFRLQLSAGKHQLDVWMNGLHAEKAFDTTAGQQLDLGELPMEPPKVGPGGTGVEFMDAQKNVVTRAITPKGPAAVGGLQVGDELVAIDGVTVKDANDANGRKNGPAGSRVVFSVRRGPAKQSLEIAVIRAK